MAEAVSLLVFGSVKSAGVTTAAVGVAAAWRDLRWAPVVECDPAGGDLCARFGLPLEPSVVGLAAGLRRGAPGVDALGAHARRVRTAAGWEADVVTGPPDPASAHAAAAVLAAQAAALRGGPGTVVLADCGRLDVGSPALPVLAAADAVVLVARARLDHLAHLSAVAPRLRQASRGPVALLLLGGDFPAAEVAKAVGLPVAGVLPVDPRGADALYGMGKPPRGAARRSPLYDALVPAAAAVAAMVGEATTQDEPAPVSPPPPAPASPPSADQVVVSR